MRDKKDGYLHDRYEMLFKNLNMADDLIKSKIVDIDYTADYGWSFMHEAAYRGHNQIVELLMRHGKDINIKNSYDQTPLHGAVTSRHVDYQFIRYLVSKGNNVNAVDREGKTPLFLVFCNDKVRLDLADELIRLGANINFVDYTWQNVLHYILNKNSPDINHVKYVIQKGIDINAKGGEFMVPPLTLSLCCKDNEGNVEANIEILKYLLFSGANVFVKDSNGISFVDYFRSYRYKKICQFLELTEKREGQLGQITQAAYKDSVTQNNILSRLEDLVDASKLIKEEKEQLELIKQLDPINKYITVASETQDAYIQQVVAGMFSTIGLPNEISFNIAGYITDLRTALKVARTCKAANDCGNTVLSILKKEESIMIGQEKYDKELITKIITNEGLDTKHKKSEPKKKADSDSMKMPITVYLLGAAFCLLSAPFIIASKIVSDIFMYAFSSFTNSNIKESNAQPVNHQDFEVNGLVEKSISYARQTVDDCRSSRKVSERLI